MSASLSVGPSIWQLVGGLLSAHDKAKAELFTQHIDPLQGRITAIHRDYLAAFQKIAGSIDSGEMDVSGASKFLKSRRRDFLHERDIARAVAVQLAEAERRPIRPDAWRAILDYCSEVNAYLSSPYQFAHGSLFTTVLHATRTNVEEKLSHSLLFRGELREREELQEFRELVESILEDRLPQAFQRLGLAYARCRTLLL